MPGINTTGKPNTADYNLGRGIIYFAALYASLPIGYRDLGNAPEFNVSVEVETLEHQSSRQGLKVVDKEVIITQKVSLTFKLDEVNFQNLALLFSGATAAFTNAAIAGFSEYTMVTTAMGGVELGKWYDLKNASGVRAYDIDSADLTLEKSGSPDVALVENTDYELDLEMGRVFLLSTAVNIAAGDQLDVTLAADAGAKTVSQVRALTTTTVAGALKFISANPANGDKQMEYQFHQVSLKADGDFSLIGDEFTTMGFKAVAERNVTADVNSPTLTIRIVNAV